MYKRQVMTYLRPDAKSQVTIEYTPQGEPVRVHTIVISTQRDDFISPEEAGSVEEADRRMLAKIKQDVEEILLPRVKAKLSDGVKAMFDENLILHVNPTGKFVIGGPHGDTGLTGRKIVVDTYGGKGAHGGGAFSGKDPSKVDRSAAYAARHIAKNLVAAGVAREAQMCIRDSFGTDDTTTNGVMISLALTLTSLRKFWMVLFSDMLNTPSLAPTLTMAATSSRLTVRGCILGEKHFVSSSESHTSG